MADIAELKRIAEIKEELAKECQMRAEAYLIGHPANEKTLHDFIFLAESYFNSAFSIEGYHWKLQNPRIERPSLVADGFKLVREVK